MKVLTNYSETIISGISVQEVETIFLNSSFYFMGNDYICISDENINNCLHLYPKKELKFFFQNYLLVN